jgi:hypothetical protein
MFLKIVGFALIIIMIYAIFDLYQTIKNDVENDIDES